MGFIINLLVLAGLGYLGYIAYKTYEVRGKTFTPLDLYFSEFVNRLLRK